MHKLFAFSYKLVPTDKPDVVYLVPTASTYAKAFGPTALVIGGLVVATAVGAYIARKEEKELANGLLGNLTD